MNQLDNFFKQKLSGADQDPAERFAYREEYWQQAEALIEADEAKRRKRRRGLFWQRSTVVAFVLALAVAWIWQHGHAPFPAKNEASARPENARPEAAFLAEKNQPGGAAETSFSKSEAPKNQVSANQNPPSRFGQNDPAQTPSKSDQTIGAAKEAWQVAVHPALAASHLKSESSVFEKNMPAAPTETAAAKTGHNFEKTPEAIGYQNFTEKIAPIETAELALLPLPSSAIARAEHRPDIGFLPAVSTLKSPARKPSVLFGLTATGTRYFHARPQDRHGFALGPSLRFGSTGQKMTLNVDVLLRRRADLRDQSAGVVRHEQRRYHFGYQSDIYQQEVLESWWLELPIYLRWHLRHLRVEAGADLGFLLGVRGWLRHFHRNSLDSAPELLSSEKIWTSTEPYWRRYVGLNLGLRYEIVRGLEIGGRFHVLPIGLRKADDNLYQNANRFWLDAGLRYFMFAQ